MSVFLIVLVLLSYYLVGGTSIWTYDCQDNHCVRENWNNSTTQVSLAECNIVCLDAGGLWPKPTGQVLISKLTEINTDNFVFASIPTSPISTLVDQVVDIFTAQIRKLKPCRMYLKNVKAKLPAIKVTLDISDTNTDTLTLITDESYSLTISSVDTKNIVIIISARTYFGARHGLETLTQLVVFDDIADRVFLPSVVSVVDAPKYPWRGVSLDTSRNYITPKVIKKTLKAMAASKLNTFHWHFTDTASFPYVSKSHPELSQLGAYAPKKVYNDDTVRDIMEYAKVRGIRVVPELDAPAHVGEGWQNTGLVTCFDWRPWISYCVEPPCGQLDPSQSQVYDYLEDIYGDMLEHFGSEIFHMGGDEVHINCWNQTVSLTKWMVDEKEWNLTTEGFMNAWVYFQAEAEKRLFKKAGKTIPVILWGSDLTSMVDVEKFLSPTNHIVQVWTDSKHSSIAALLNKNYSIILSNYDALYLDCGLSAWVSAGNNWCSPYKGWQLLYDNKPSTIAGDRAKQVLGGEAVLWTEETGSTSVETRMWPRAAAFAETLWTEPTTNWRAAQDRMFVHRDRLVSLGIGADALQPEWCVRNQQACPLGG